MRNTEVTVDIVEGPEEVETYCVGDFIRISAYADDDYIHILAGVDRGFVAAIGIDDGNRWSSPVAVGNVLRITAAEMKNIVPDCAFTRAKSVEIKVTM